MPEPFTTDYSAMKFIINETYRQSIFDTFKTVSWTFSSKFQDGLGLLWRNLSMHDLARRNSAKFKGDEGSRTNLTHGQFTFGFIYKKEPTSTQPISGNCRGRLYVLWK